ncbi:MAG: hypothetical protein D3923_14305 [Candidatus Electrothrix sp. AR3]|nr:hypothetical protein [Candidatus Electrothrix sp. AR3]
MAKDCCSKKKSPWWPLVIIGYFIINFRVEAGFATTFERMIDGLVAGVVLLLLIYIGAKFFKFIEVADDDDLLSYCGGTSCCDDKK